MSKVYKYVTNEKKVCQGMKEVSLKKCSIHLTKIHHLDKKSQAKGSKNGNLLTKK
jgi:hypothetical protein